MSVSTGRQGTSPESDHIVVIPESRESSRRRRVRQRIVFVVALLAALLILDGIWVAFVADRELQDARDSLSQAVTSISSGDISTADGELARARDASASAQGMFVHPAARLGEVLPWIGDDVRATHAIADASNLASRAGIEAVDALQGTGLLGASGGSLSSGGALPLEGLRSAAPKLETASHLLGSALDQLRPFATDHLLGQVGTAMTAARTELTQADRAALSASRLGQLLPGFLGGDGTRHYILLVQNLSDPRGSGGFPGMYGVLTARDGHLTMGDLEPTNATLGAVPSIHAPSPDVAERYGRLGGLTHFISTTYSPDFPTSARTFLAMWDAKGKPAVDGVISVDSVFMAQLLAVSGPVTTPAWSEPLTSDNVSDVLDAQTFETTSAGTSNRRQEELGSALWAAILERPLPPADTARAVSTSVAQRHLQVFAVDPHEEGLLGQLDASGHVALGPDTSMVAWSGLSGSRAGYFARRSVHYDVALSPDGSATTAVNVTLTNTADPGAAPSILTGTSSTGGPVGSFDVESDVYLPPGAKDIHNRVLGTTGVDIVQHEFGVPVAVQVLSTKAGGHQTSVVSYRSADASTTDDTLHRWTLEVLPQPSLQPQRTSLTLTLPPGAEVVSTSPAMSLDGSTVTLAPTDLTQPLRLEVSYRQS